ncbi:carbonic anhydrase [Bisporella sp. PMI_857]|nr:carbonic anhydrase [Bisporella sp. PMI_857]
MPRFLSRFIRNRKDSLVAPVAASVSSSTVSYSDPKTALAAVIPLSSTASTKSLSQLTVENLLERNKSRPKDWAAIPTLTEAAATGFIPPRIIVISCCDVRVHPKEFLYLEHAEAFVLETVGGHVAPCINDIVTLDGFIGVREIMIIHHTDCGALVYKDETIREFANGYSPGSVDETTSFGAIEDLEQSVRDDITILKSSAIIRKELKDATRGFIFDIKTGLVSAVE